MKRNTPKYTDKVLGEMMINRIKEIRNYHNHSQEYVMENTGVDVSHIENGRDTPTVISISRLCRFYNLTLDEFFVPMNYPPKK